jgi:hypothetical protein
MGSCSRSFTCLAKRHHLLLLSAGQLVCFAFIPTLAKRIRAAFGKKTLCVVFCKIEPRVRSKDDEMDSFPQPRPLFSFPGEEFHLSLLSTGCFFLLFSLTVRLLILGCDEMNKRKQTL